MKNKKLGFTLIELLVVIVILAIVALITTPIVLDVIEKATDKANRSSAYGIMETAKLYRIEEMFKDRPVPETNILSTLKVKGSKPKNGDVRVNNSGYIAIALQYGNKCYTKAFEDEDITVLDDFEECKLPEPPKPPFDDVKLVNRPQLTEGMTPIKWDASNNEITTNEEDDEWYDYSTKKWANVKTADGSYWVWIPRYAYKMNGGYHSNVASSFDIKFLREKTNEPTDNTTIETEGYVADLDSNASTTKNTKNFYFLHPAFQNDINAYGFWVAKFEPSVSNPIDPCYTKQVQKTVIIQM